jgi:hypothetical protein
MVEKKVNTNVSEDFLEMLDAAVSVPRRKPDQRVTGRLLKWDDTDAAVFLPQQPKEQPARTVLKQSKGSAYYRNEGKKSSSYSYHVNVPETEEDPAGYIINKAMEDLGDEAKKMPKTTAKRYVLHTDNVKIWKDTQAKTLSVYIEADMSVKRSALQDKLRELFVEVYKSITDM